MFIKSKILRSPHAFSTREGGVSKNAHTKSLNLAFGRGDEDSVVLENLNIFAAEVGFDPHSVVSHPQIHSDKVINVTPDMRGDGYFIREGIEGCDGYFTDSPEVTLGVKSADCVPILLEAEKDGRIVAVGAVHAGWRGSVAKIADICADKLCKLANIGKESIRAAIGPCIHACCYEVGVELLTAAENAVGEKARDFFTPAKDEGKFFFDLPSFNKSVLTESGLLPENIEIVDHCTCCESKLFFSHRYSGGHRGTMLSVIFMEKQI